MKKSFLRISVYILISFGVMVSCKKEETSGPDSPAGVTATRVDNLTADTGHTGIFTYYSLRTNSIIPSNDSATVSWDMAFGGTTIRVNSGTSGPGQGGAIVLTQTFNDVVEAPASGYAVDNAPASYAIPTGSGNGWYTYNFATNTITPTAGKTIVIKTADGKYAKVEILSYYKNAPANPDTTSVSRFYTFQYIFQADGTRKLN